MTTDIDLRDKLLKAYREELWRRKQVWPLLEEYLDRDQLEDTRRFFEGCDVQRAELPKLGWYDDISRQRGKSYKWCVISVVWCHCHAGQFIKYAAQLGVSVRGIIVPTINKLVAHMPEDLRPSEDKVDHIWRFPKANGAEPSEIKAAGVNMGHYDDLRGPKAHIVIEDEAAFYDEFDKVQQVLGPQLQTTKGVKVFATTPPWTTTHPIEKVMQGLKGENRYSHRTIYNHPRMTPEEIEQHLTAMAKERGLELHQFKETAYYQREYLCMHVVETSRAVVPEWSAVAGQGYPEGATWGDVHTLGGKYTPERPRPLFFLTYDSLDLGFTRDPSAWLGGYWDFDRAQLVIELESPPLFRKRAEELAAQAVELRRLLWPASGPKPYPEAEKSPDGTYWLPFRAIGDAGGMGAERLEEMAKEGVRFEHAEKADVESMVSELRGMVARGKIWVSEKCPVLRRQLGSGLWADKAKTDFERDPVTGEHLDHVAALIYMVRHLVRDRNPVPPGYGIDAHNTINMYQQAPTHVNVTPLDMVAGNISWGEDE